MSINDYVTIHTIYNYGKGKVKAARKISEPNLLFLDFFLSMTDGAGAYFPLDGL